MSVSIWANFADQSPFPLIPDDLKGKGKIIGFLSPAPGAGATTLACLASLAAAEERVDVALCDFNQRGKVRTYLGLTADVCPASILDASKVDTPEEIGNVGVLHPRKVFVVPGVSRGIDSSQVSAALILKVLSLLKNSFDLVIAVLGPLCTHGWAAALVCNTIWLVTQPMRPDFDFIADDSELLSRLGCEERMKVVLNRSTLPGSINERESINALRADVVVPYIPQIIVSCNKRYPEIPKKIHSRIFDLARF